MRRIALLLAAMALLVAACGDDDAAPDETSAATTATTAATATTAPAETTTTAAASTTEAAINPLLEAALELEGSHTGEWNNTTFGSTGAIEIEIGVDEESEVATVRLDLGGFVFGGDDPDAQEYEFDLSIGDPSLDAYEFPFDDPLFGDDAEWRFDSDGTFSFTAPSVPGVGGLEMTIEGQFTETGAEGTYTITGLADGTFTLVANG